MTLERNILDVKRGGTLRVLLVEDSPTDAQLLEISLAGEFPSPLSLTVAECLQRAVALLHEQSFDVVLLDLDLPDSSGMDSVRRLSAEIPRLPIVILTGMRDESQAMEAIDLGVQDYLIKGQAGGRTIARVISYAILRQRAEEMVHRANADLERRVQERTAQLRSLASELILAEQRERRRIAEYLHDSLQQLLVSSKLSVGMLQMGLKNKRLAASLEAIERQLGTAIETSRSLTAELSPPVLYRAGLAAALTWLGKRLEELHGLKVVVQAEPGADIGEESVRVLLFQSVRELLFNVIKHAGVDQARIRLAQREGEGIRIEVRDEGQGFDLGQIRAEGFSESFGLFSVRERIGQMGGRMEIRSAPGKGTLVTLIVPAGGRAAAATPATKPAPSSRRKPSGPKRNAGRASS